MSNNVDQNYIETPGRYEPLPVLTIRSNAMSNTINMSSLLGGERLRASDGKDYIYKKQLIGRRYCYYCEAVQVASVRCFDSEGYNVHGLRITEILPLKPTAAVAAPGPGALRHRRCAAAPAPEGTRATRRTSAFRGVQHWAHRW